MIREVLRMGDARLLEKARPVEDFASPELRELLVDMRDTMHHLGGVGLAAPQIGVSLCVVIFGFEANARYPEEAPVPNTVLINPQLTPLSDEMAEGWEGCLSIPGMRGLVSRWRHLRYSGYDESGVFFEKEAADFHARVVQHECDHLEGMLYPMRMNDLSRFGFVDAMAGMPTPVE